MVGVGGGLLEFAYVPQLDSFIVRAGSEHLVRWVSCNSLDRIAMSLSNGAVSRDLINENILGQLESYFLTLVLIHINKI